MDNLIQEKMLYAIDEFIKPLKDKLQNLDLSQDSVANWDQVKTNLVIDILSEYSQKIKHETDINYYDFKDLPEKFLDGIKTEFQGLQNILDLLKNFSLNFSESNGQSLVDMIKELIENCNGIINLFDQMAKTKYIESYDELESVHIDNPDDQQYNNFNSFSEFDQNNKEQQLDSIIEMYVKPLLKIVDQNIDVLEKFNADKENVLNIDEIIESINNIKNVILQEYQKEIDEQFPNIKGIETQLLEYVSIDEIEKDFVIFKDKVDSVVQEFIDKRMAENPNMALITLKQLKETINRYINGLKDTKLDEKDAALLNNMNDEIYIGETFKVPDEDYIKPNNSADGLLDAVQETNDFLENFNKMNFGEEELEEQNEELQSEGDQEVNNNEEETYFSADDFIRKIKEINGYVEEPISKKTDDFLEKMRELNEGSYDDVPLPPEVEIKADELDISAIDDLETLEDADGMDEYAQLLDKYNAVADLLTHHREKIIKLENKISKKEKDYEEIKRSNELKKTTGARMNIKDAIIECKLYNLLPKLKEQLDQEEKSIEDLEKQLEELNNVILSRDKMDISTVLQTNHLTSVGDYERILGNQTSNDKTFNIESEEPKKRI